VYNLGIVPNRKNKEKILFPVHQERGERREK